MLQYKESYRDKNIAVVNSFECVNKIEKHSWGRDELVEITTVFYSAYK